MAIDKENISLKIAFDEELIRNWYSEFNLRLIEPIHYGNWSGREKFLLRQDNVIAEKN